MPQDHPRRCGENSDSCSPYCSTIGSPPQVRGKPKYQELTTTMTGITPAGAGKTIKDLQNKTTRWDHPRRCGENYEYHLYRAFRKGSPPQVRGKLKDVIIEPVEIGITPAGAGKTPVRASFSRRIWDHPRRCGENENIPFKEHTSIGSPPQVRGKPCTARAISF